MIPLYISHREFKNMTFRILKPMGTGNFDYILPLLSIKNSPEKQLKKAFEAIYDDKKSWDCIDWGDIPEHSIMDQMLRDPYLRKKMLVKRKRSCICPYLPLKEDAEAVERQYDQKLLNEIVAKERKLKRKGKLLYQKVTRTCEIEPVLNKFFQFHCERWANSNTPSRFEDNEEKEYILQAANRLFERGLLHLAYLIHNDNIAAVEFAMADRNKIYLYLTAFNQKYKNYSAGNILLYQLIRRACKEGFNIVDFTRGNESYKFLWGTRGKFNVECLLFHRSAKSRLLKGIYGIYYSEQTDPMFFGKRLLLKSIIRGTVFAFSIPGKFRHAMP
jgi:CelD/BcsL family acetyltransferase involved in cellulose biosynthesis